MSYFAGFFDGEGSVLIYRRNARMPRGKTPPYQIRATITNTNHEVIECFRDRFGGHVQEYGPEARRRRAWKWTIQCRGAESFLIAIRPYLVVKGKEADVAIAMQGRIAAFKIRNHAKGTWGALPLPSSELEARDTLHAKLQALRAPAVPNRPRLKGEHAHAHFRSRGPRGRHRSRLPARGLRAIRTRGLAHHDHLHRHRRRRGRAGDRLPRDEPRARDRQRERAGDGNADTLQFEVTDTSTWVSANAYPLPSGPAVTSTAANGIWQVDTAGAKRFRVRASAGAAATIVMMASLDSALAAGGTQSVTGTGTAGTPAAGVVTVQGIAAMTPIQVQGETASGSAPGSENPLMMGAFDTANMQKVQSDTSGRLKVVGRGRDRRGGLRLPGATWVAAPSRARPPWSRSR
jgi:hypothetical protein